MMTRVTVTARDRDDESLLAELHAPKVVTIGRNPASTVPIDDPALSWDALRLDLDAHIPAGRLSNTNGGMITTDAERRAVARGATATFLLGPAVVVDLQASGLVRVAVSIDLDAAPPSAAYGPTTHVSTKVVESLADHLLLERRRDDLLLLTALACDWVAVPAHGDRRPTSSSHIPTMLAECAPTWFEGKSPPARFQPRNMNEILRRCATRLATVEAQIHLAFHGARPPFELSIDGYVCRAIAASEERGVGMTYWAVAQALPETVCDPQLAHAMQQVRDTLGEQRLDRLHRTANR